MVPAPCRLKPLHGDRGVGVPGQFGTNGKYEGPIRSLCGSLFLGGANYIKKVGRRVFNFRLSQMKYRAATLAT